MEWHQFLREERARKLAQIQVLMSGTVTIIVRTGNDMEDVSASIMQENLRHLAEIDAILLAAGLLFEDEGQPLEP